MIAGIRYGHGPSVDYIRMIYCCVVQMETAEGGAHKAVIV